MASPADLLGLGTQIEMLRPVWPVGRVSRVRAGVIELSGLADDVKIGDRIRICRMGLSPLDSEVVQLLNNVVLVLPEETPDGVALNDRAVLRPELRVAPSDAWLGRMIDPSGRPIDGRPLLSGPNLHPLRASPPDAARRMPLGGRLNTGMAVTNTLLPIAEGQRVGLFAGSGVGKSNLLGGLAAHMQADVVVVALIGERGRELRHFTENVMGSEGRARSVVVAATSDQSALQRRRCVWTAMTVAEHFRDKGKSVLLIADLITRFAEAHREVAVAAGEAPVLRGYPPSTQHMIMSLCERAGPGQYGQGQITALFSVLVAGSDMDEPIADIMRGVLDGHIVLDRTIAERGRYPAIDVLQSVSRSLPAAASEAENEVLNEVRKLLGHYERNAVMIRAGLYTPGTDPALDRAVTVWPDLDAFWAQKAPQDCAHSFKQLNLILRRAQTASRSQSRSPAKPS